MAPRPLSILRLALTLAATSLGLPVTSSAQDGPQHDGPQRDGHVEAELVADRAAVQPGEPVVLGVRLQMDDHWHVYWINPGDSGLATTIEWDLPAGFVDRSEEAGIRWPAPTYLEAEGLASYAYEGEVVLPAAVEVPADAPVGSSVTIRATVEWLMCKEACIPGQATISLRLPVVSAEAPTAWSPRGRELLATAAARAPVELAAPAVALEATRAGEHLDLAISPAALGLDRGPVASARFFAYDPGLLAMAAPQPLEVSGAGRVRLRLPLATTASPPERLRGVLVCGSGARQRAFAIDVSINDSAGAPGGPADPAIPSLER